jgi:unsaturated chondroitin disaccharide hydrolase
MSTNAPAVQVVSHISLDGTGATATRLLPHSWQLSFDVRLSQRSRLDVGLGAAGALVSFVGPKPSLIVDGRSYSQRTPPGWLGGGWLHVEAVPGRVAVDGREFHVAVSRARSMTFQARRGRADIEALIISAASAPGGVLLHRLAELHARIPPRRFPLGADLADRIRYASRYWTSGFWPGALWQAAALAPADGLFARWARSVTIEHFGEERLDTHDVGFKYGESSLAAWRALCQGRGDVPALCSRLRRSVLSAAEELVSLAATNSAAGTIPTDARSIEANTIVDSMMNIAILPWASRVTGNPLFARIASRHAHEVAALLVRPDGSTTQSVNFDRATGRVLFTSTHQGLSATSTWSRGQGWAVYGFAQAAVDLHDTALLRVAERAAGYVASHLPAGGIPRWDYDAPAGAPVDVSAGVITAAGLLHLARACRSIPGVCTAPARWAALGERMLTAALSRAYSQPPLGFLASQVLNERRRCWCDRGELIFGLTYGVEAVNLARAGLRGGVAGAARAGS